MGVERLLADPAFPRGGRLRAVDPGMVAAMSETVLRVLDWHRVLYLPRAAAGPALAPAQAVSRLGPHGRLLGLGELGSDVARKLAALGFNVAGWSRRPKDLPGVTCLTQLERCSREATWWSACCRLPRTPRAS